MSREKNKWNVRGISFSGKESLYMAAAAKAKRLRRSFSNYVCGVLEDDLAKDKPVMEAKVGLNDTLTSYKINSVPPDESDVSPAEQTALAGVAAFPVAPISKYPPIPPHKPKTARRPSRKKPVSK